ncbi:hypothetical protein HID58_070435, partial [Brassica napus]
EGSNLNYVIMAVDEQNELPEATQREAELQRQLDGLQSQVTELHKTREEANPELSSEVQSPKEKLNERSKQLGQSAKKLSQLESDNLNLQDENQALNAASNKKRRFQAHHDELPEATKREAEFQRQIDDLQGQVTGLHRTREETNPELSSEFQILKEKFNEHSKQLEQSAEKLSQLESENLTLRDENQTLNTASNKK